MLNDATENPLYRCSRLALLLLVCSFSVCGYGQKQVRRVLFRQANVIPMTEERVLQGQDVLIEDGVIKAISSRHLKADSGTQVIEARGKFLIPGLCDMHIHTDFGDEQQLRLYVTQGVTTVLDLRGSDRDLNWRKQIAAGELLGPTLYLSGPILDGDPKRTDHVFVKDREAAVAIVKQQAQAGYDFLKPYSNLSPESYDAIVEEARRQHIRLVGHVPKKVGVLNVIRAKQDAIAHHEELYRFFVDRSKDPWDKKPDPGNIPELAEELLDNHVWVVSTLSAMTNILDQATDPQSFLARPEMRYVPASYMKDYQSDADSYPKRGEQWLAQNKIMVPFLFQLAGELNKSGVPLMAGTDATNPIQIPGLSMHDELEVLVKAGLSRYQALVAATSAPARFLNRNAGTIEEGRIADLVLLDGNPLSKIENSRNVRGVLLRGAVWLDQASLEHLDAEFIEHSKTE